jgi:hypothetical protein
MITNEKSDRDGVIVDEPGYEELIASAQETLFKQGKRAKKGSLELVPWSSISIPANATELEKLTYVPGLVGEMTEWIVRGAPRPNRMMALCASVVTVGTLIGRYVRGPTGSSTALYLIMLALSGYGKEWPLKAGRVILDALGLSQLIGPSEWSGQPGFTQVLVRQPLLCCFVDEFGDEIALLNSQRENGFVWKMLGLLKKCYNAWESFDTAETRLHQTVRIDWAALSVVGASTPKAFFSALLPNDVDGGFANRILALPFEGMKRPAEQKVHQGAQDPPRDLIAKLRLLPHAPDAITEKTFEGRPGHLLDIPWGPGAEDRYFELSREMDQYEGKDDKRHIIGMRVCENSSRFATDVAVGRGSPTVEFEDIDHAIKICMLSFEAMVGGVAKYMKQYYEFPEFCDVIAQAFRQQGFISKSKLNRDYFRNMRWGNELERVIGQLQKQGLIELVSHSPTTGGHAAEGWKWKG